MKHRLLSFLTAALAILLLLPPLGFSFIHGAIWPGGFFQVSGSAGSQFSSPGWAAYNLTCNSRMGRVLVKDDITGKALLNASVLGHAQFVIALPHAGDYSVHAVGNTSLVCTAQIWKPYATRRVQDASYIGSSAFLLLFAFLLWRWWS